MNIGIIGAGVTGLAAAWDLLHAGHTVTLYEAEDRVGGLAGGFRDDAAGWAWSLEKFYHHWFETDSDILKLADELGIRDNILFPRPKTSYWMDGKIIRSEMNASALFLPVPPLSIIRLGLVGVFLKLTQNWRALERVTAHDWFMRWLGEAAYNKLFRPLLIGKFGEAYTRVNMAWMWARIKTRSLRLGIYEGGFQAFLDTFADKVRAQGGTIYLGTRVDAIGQDADGKPTLTVGGATHTFDRVLSTSSPSLLLRLAPQLRETPYGAQVGALYSIGALCVVFALKHSLLTDGTYWLNLPATSADKAKSPFPFLALVEHTNFMDKAHYGGDVLVYCGDYVPVDHEYLKLSEAELIERFIPALAKANPAFSRDWIRRAWVWRAPYAQPVPYVNHSQNIPALRTPLNGVWWASMSQVYPYDRGTNYAVEIGRRAAREMMG